MPVISRAEAVACINAGVSVLYQPDKDGNLAGVHAVTLDQLPDEAYHANAAKDPAKVVEARKALLASKKAIEAQLANLDGPDTIEPAKPEATKLEPVKPVKPETPAKPEAK